MQGIVKEIIYKDSNSEALYSILVQFNASGQKSQREQIAFPLDTNIKRVPVVGEAVNLMIQVYQMLEDHKLIIKLVFAGLLLM